MCPGDIIRSRVQFDFRFHGVRFSVNVSNTKATLMGGKAGLKEILKSVSGAVGSGQILAIIGASGAGKTSLLDVLVGKVSFSVRSVTIVLVAACRLMVLDEMAQRPRMEVTDHYALRTGIDSPRCRRTFGPNTYVVAGPIPCLWRRNRHISPHLARSGQGRVHRGKRDERRHGERRGHVQRLFSGERRLRASGRQLVERLDR